MSDPYAGTVPCRWCGAPAAGKVAIGDRIEYACRGHVDLALVAGWYKGLLPTMPEAHAIMHSTAAP